MRLAALIRDMLARAANRVAPNAYPDYSAGLPKRTANRVAPNACHAHSAASPIRAMNAVNGG